MTWDENISYLLHSYWLINKDLFCNFFRFVAPTYPRPLNLLASALKITLSSFGTYLWDLHQLKYTRISSHNIPTETCYGRRHLWLIVPLSSHQQLFGRWSMLYCDRELCLYLSGESVISPICSSTLFSSTWKTPQDDGTKKILYRSVVWKWVSMFVAFWILNTDFCFCVTAFVPVRSHLSWRRDANHFICCPWGISAFLIISPHFTDRNSQHSNHKSLRNVRNVASHVFVWWFTLIFFFIPAVCMYAFCLH